MEWVNRYADLMKAQGVGHLRFGNLVLREYGKIIIPIGPVIQEKPSIQVDKKLVFKYLKGNLIWWSYPDERHGMNGWYAVVKKKATELSDYSSSNIRNQIKKGLSNNSVKRITLDFLKNQGYPVYKIAMEGYGKRGYSSEVIYKEWLSKYKGFEDIIHFWGIFNSNELIGYSVVYTYDKLEANISEIRINPNHYKDYPIYALIHTITLEYLKNEGFQCMSDGYRNIFHSTQIQELLIQKFGFYKEPLFLELAISKKFDWALKLFYAMRFLPIFPKSIRSVFILMEIRRQQKGAI